MDIFIMVLSYNIKHRDLLFMLGNVEEGVRLPAMYASVIGSNLGVLLTAVGALAGLMWMSILKNADIKLNFFTYIKDIFIVGLVTLFVSLLLLQIMI